MTNMELFLAILLGMLAVVVAAFAFMRWSIHRHDRRDLLAHPRNKRKRNTDGSSDPGLGDPGALAYSSLFAMHAVSDGENQADAAGGGGDGGDGGGGGD